jgi:transposase
LKTSIILDDDIAAVKALLREYHAMKKEASMYICRLKNQLRQIFSQYLPLFSKVNGKASLAVLAYYPSPAAVLATGAETLTELIRKVAGKGAAMAKKKASDLLSAAQEALSFGHGNSGITFLIGHYVEMIRILGKRTAAVLKQMKQILLERPDSLLARQTQLLESIPGARFLTAVTIVCEIGDFSAFRCPKKLYSYFGFAPVVRQSGNSATADLRMSKLGSPFARRCFYMLALQSVSLRKNGEPKNPVLRAYYLEKCKTKAKMTALGAIIHKLCNIIFAVLRDETQFVLISPLEHCRKYSSISQAARAFATSFLRPCGASAFLYLWGTTTLFTCFLQQPLDFS